MGNEPEVVEVDGRTQAEKDEALGWWGMGIGCVVILLFGLFAVGCWYIAGALSAPVSGFTLIGILLCYWLLTRR